MLPKIDPADGLAVVATKLKKHSRLGYAGIGRVAGLSRQGIKSICDGDTIRPDAETLCRFAVGVLTDPNDGSIDQEELVRTLGYLGRAAGYDDLRATCMETVLPVLLTVITADHGSSAAWIAMADHQTPATADEVAGFDALVTATRAGSPAPHQGRRPRRRED